MDTDVDLTELDDWLGTLEELQLGLEKDRASSQTLNTSFSSTPNASQQTNRPSYVNRTFQNDQKSPRRAIPPVRESSVPLSYSTRETSSLAEARSPVRKLSFANDRTVSVQLSQARLSGSGEVPLNGRACVHNALFGKGFKEATAERDLSSLLRDLEVVEERMKELEQENNVFTRRYSLASSPTTSQPVNSMSNGNGFTRNDVQTRRSDSVYTRAENGFISAQWAAEVNRDIKPEVSVIKSVSSDSAPPACLGAGDACVSPPTSPQPNTPSMALLQATEAGLWCVQNSPSRPQTHTTTVGNGSHVIASTEQHTNRPCPTSPLRKTPGLFPNGEAHYMYQNYETQEKVIEEMKALAAQRALRSPIYANDVQLGTATSSPQTYIPTSRQTPIPPPRQYVESPHIVSPNSCSSPVSQQQCQLVKKLARDGDDDSSLSGISSWSPGQPPATQKRDLIKGTTLSPPSMTDRLSGSLSPSSSTSDKSGSDHADGNLALHGSRRTLDQNNVKKLVVRIFRPDKTTKAIMIEERMNAGEVASLLIEKNFLKPSTSLAVVEKVPALKIEHVFEEHENVADCILSWPTGSQNMLFFEERKDHFGFIESPKLWFGEEFAEVHRYNSADAVQMMLNNIDQAGFPEWRDYLYIRKPGEKTWSRRLCVLRSSGLYTSKKNKKTLASFSIVHNHWWLDTTKSTYAARIRLQTLFSTGSGVNTCFLFLCNRRESFTSLGVSPSNSEIWKATIRGLSKCHGSNTTANSHDIRCPHWTSRDEWLTERMHSAQVFLRYSVFLSINSCPAARRQCFKPRRWNWFALDSKAKLPWKQL
ncbi:hypothetical protein T265_10655 [Opisthorchis viverrini]|uniref:Ras-associating domain-containing protein n=1 Tax=Opisthorchis viverrini TaxID=6198 RepID=A0A074Z1M3_OPIVI|nr:hypothetical protein T265_10655 [Opisthorchis viverrini]KER20883.1 hypothetical protein T265_10655 [Opisthorchis viverrini]